MIIVKKEKRKKKKEKRKKKKIAKDPTCGMKVDPKKAKFKVVKSGKKYYFCSKNCHDKFLGKNKLIKNKLN